ncbi:MAG: Uma2 family endonuclease [Lewinellaceae bacterium]|nr:Uma2 family endonuclease [Lewinella sp.]MCB9279953.1 Uma2 family endonuclease [Lewinellaceae bacterium]
MSTQEGHQNIVEELLAKPDAALVVEEVRTRLAEEKQKRDEYYGLIHENIKAEFINGEIIYQSPVKRKHWKISARLSARLIQYVDDHDLGEVGVEKVMVSLSRNDYEPDICFFTKAKSQHFSRDQMHFPAPDFIVEILSESTENVDRKVKYNDYAAHGIEEYWIIDPDMETIEQYFSENRIFRLNVKLAGSGIIKSRSIKGFEMDIAALFV